MHLKSELPQHLDDLTSELFACFEQEREALRESVGGPLARQSQPSPEYPIDRWWLWVDFALRAFRESGPFHRRFIGLLLFSIDAQFQGELDNNTISEVLRQEFEDNKITLPQNATVTIVQSPREWLIIGVDNKPIYRVRKAKRKLNIIALPEPKSAPTCSHRRRFLEAASNFLGTLLDCLGYSTSVMDSPDVSSQLLKDCAWLFAEYGALEYGVPWELPIAQALECFCQEKEVYPEAWCFAIGQFFHAVDVWLLGDLLLRSNVDGMPLAKHIGREISGISELESLEQIVRANHFVAAIFHDVGRICSYVPRIWESVPTLAQVLLPDEAPSREALIENALNLAQETNWGAGLTTTDGVDHGVLSPYNIAQRAGKSPLRMEKLRDYFSIRPWSAKAFWPDSSEAIGYQRKYPIEGLIVDVWRLSEERIAANELNINWDDFVAWSVLRRRELV